jgi:hypothetical protein
MEAKVARTSAVCHNSHRESECRTRSSQEGRAFLCCPYVGDEQGRYRPTEGISQCPTATGAERCCLKKHAWRERKTGPCVPLRLMYCRSHDRHFTVYPMGHVPYSRRRVLPVGLAAVVGTSETTERFLHGLHTTISRWGRMKALYLDRGPGFISEDAPDRRPPPYQADPRHRSLPRGTRQGRAISLDCLPASSPRVGSESRDRSHALGSRAASLSLALSGLQPQPSRIPRPAVASRPLAQRSARARLPGRPPVVR